MRLKLTGLALVAASCCATAGNLSATAYQNLIYTDTHSTSGAEIGASTPTNSYGGYAAVQTYRTGIHAASYGYGAHATTAFTGYGGGLTNYQLWDLTTNTALTSAQAETITLDFNFSITGFLATDPISLSGASISYDFYNYSDREKSSATYVYGPGPGGDQYLASGNLSLIGPVSQSFKLEHSNRNDGYISTFLSVNAENAAYADFAIELTSVTFKVGSSPISSLGVRIVETAAILPVSAVAEPAPAALLALGLALLTLVSHARRVPHTA